MNQPSTIDKSIFAIVESLAFLAESTVEGFLTGLHRSPFTGFSTEFDSYRPYIQGDGLRQVDWKVWARTDKLYVKQFEDQTNMPVWIFLDGSASMDFGKGTGNKFTRACQIAAALAYLMNRQHDAAGLVIYGGTRPVTVPPATTRDHLNDLFLALASEKITGNKDETGVLMSLLPMIRRKGISVVISDCLAPAAHLRAFLKGLRAQRQEVILFHIMSPSECDLGEYNGAFVMQDRETGEELLVDAHAYRKRYAKIVRDFREEFATLCQEEEARYHFIRTDDSLEKALLEYFSRRVEIL